MAPDTKRSGPVAGAGSTRRPTKTTASVTPRWEYRVWYRRATWSATSTGKTRTFDRGAAARAFVAKLTGDGRPDLGRAEVRVSRRPVGAWVDLDGWSP